MELLGRIQEVYFPLAQTSSPKNLMLLKAVDNLRLSTQGKMQFSSRIKGTDLVHRWPRDRILKSQFTSSCNELYRHIHKSVL